MSAAGGLPDSRSPCSRRAARPRRTSSSSRRGSGRATRRGPRRRPSPRATAGSSPSGRTREIRALAGPKTASSTGRAGASCPGFIDCHTHMSMGGFNLLARGPAAHEGSRRTSRAQLAGFAKTRPAGPVADRRRLGPPAVGEPEACRRARCSIPRPATARPASSRQDGHMMVCNSLALEAREDHARHAGSAGRRHRAGRLGRADRRPEGRGDGRSSARCVRRARSRGRRRRSRTAMRHAAENGVTSVQDLPGQRAGPRRLGKARQRGRADRPRQLPAFALGVGEGARHARRR